MCCRGAPSVHGRVCVTQASTTIGGIHEVQTYRLRNEGLFLHGLLEKPVRVNHLGPFEGFVVTGLLYEPYPHGEPGTSAESYVLGVRLMRVPFISIKSPGVFYLDPHEVFEGFHNGIPQKNSLREKKNSARVLERVLKETDMRRFFFLARTWCNEAIGTFGVTLYRTHDPLVHEVYFDWFLDPQEFLTLVRKSGVQALV